MKTLSEAEAWREIARLYGTPNSGVFGAATGVFYLRNTRRVISLDLDRKMRARAEKHFAVQGAGGWDDGAFQLAALFLALEAEDEAK